ncbi:MAG TPA: VTT domain-containing protein [Candidatus Deferrimicrobiaceae bacterium]
MKTETLLKAATFLLLAGLAGYVLFFTSTGTLFLTPGGRKEMAARIDHLVRSAGIFAPAVFCLVYSLGVLVLPATAFTAAGALIFGKYFGTIYSFLGAMAGASASFFLGRYFLRDFAERMLTGTLGSLDRKAGQHGFSVIFYLRVFWFPFIVLNYGAGATRIRFQDYFWGTFFGILPAIAIVSFFFGNLKEIAASFRGPSDLLQAGILVPAALLFLSFFLPGLVKRIRKDGKAGTAA